MMHVYEGKPDFWLIKKGDLVLIHTTLFPNVKYLFDAYHY